MQPFMKLILALSLSMMQTASGMFTCKSRAQLQLTLYMQDIHFSSTIYIDRHIVGVFQSCVYYSLLYSEQTEKIPPLIECLHVVHTSR